MKCKAVKREIEEAAENALPTESVRAHLLTCTACRVFSRERAALKGLMASLGAVEAPDNFDWRLRARLAEARSETRRPFRFTPFTASAPSIAVAASFVILVMATIVYKQFGQEPENVSQPASVAQAAKENPTAVEPAGNSDSLAPLQDKQGAAATNPGAVASTRGRNTRPARSNLARMETANASGSQRIFSNDFGSRGAQDLVPSALNNSLTGAGPVITVPVRSSGQPARLQFEDGLGAKRTLSLNPVNFGGQEAIERRDAARLVPTSAQGIW